LLLVDKGTVLLAVDSDSFYTSAALPANSAHVQ